MDYAEARDAFFQPRDEADPPPGIDWATPARRLRDAIEPVATIHFWSEPASERYAAIGLDFLTGYVWSRSCVLGEPSPTVAAAAFGVFDPDALAGLYTAAREACSLDAIRAAREDGAVASLRAVLGDEDPDAGVVAALKRAGEATDLSGRPLYAGLRGLPWPEDAYGQVWHACNLLREARFDGHLGALAAAGIGGLEANILTETWVGWSENAYTASRAWSPEVIAEAARGLRDRGLLSDDDRLTDAGTALRRDVEAATDTSMAAAMTALGDDVDAVVAAATTWADAIVERGWFPPDDYKRASG